MKHPAELSFEESCKLELKLKEQEVVIVALREESLYWRNLLKEMCDNMDLEAFDFYKLKKIGSEIILKYSDHKKECNGKICSCGYNEFVTDFNRVK
jgi:hypothetical protein